jgi:hypothetical protein
MVGAMRISGASAGNHSVNDPAHSLDVVAICGHIGLI